MFKAIDYSLRLKMMDGAIDKEILPSLFQLHKIFDE